MTRVNRDFPNPIRRNGIADAIWRAARFIGLASLGRAAASRWPFLVKVEIIGGQRIFVDLRSGIGRGLFATGSFDMAAIRPALDALVPGATFIDVGANIGFYSVLASDLVGPSGHVYCFEIDPRPLRALRKTIVSLNIKNIHVMEAAVSDVDGTLTFVPADEHGHNQIGQADGPGRSVNSVRLDTWAKQKALARLHVIKIDVEGAEKLVIQGARETIARFKPLIVCEASDAAVTFGYHPNDLVEIFAEIGYAAEWLEGVWTPTLLARPRTTG